MEIGRIILEFGAITALTILAERYISDRAALTVLALCVVGLCVIHRQWLLAFGREHRVVTVALVVAVFAAFGLWLGLVLTRPTPERRASASATPVTHTPTTDAKSVSNLDPQQLAQEIAKQLPKPSASKEIVQQLPIRVEAKAKVTKRARRTAHSSNGAPPDAPINSVIENAGEVNQVDISGAQVSAPQGGQATVLKNLPGGTASGVRIKEPQVGSRPVLQHGTDGPAIEVGTGPGMHREIIEDNLYCDTDQAFIAVRPGGTIANSTVRKNKPVNCEWITFLSEIVNDPQNLKSNLDNFSKGLERSWKGLDPATRRKNHDQLSNICAHLLSIPTEKLHDEANGLMLEPPDFDIAVGRLSMQQK